jgi:DNA invertase Pin-like site-specific DNA recombinase
MAFDPSYLHLVYPDTTFEALLYGRASRDPNKRGDSVEDQLGWGRTLCKTHNWPIVEEFKDTGLSASRHAKRTRDDFEDLLEAIEDTPARPGVTRIVVAYEASRYYRDLEAYVRLRAACLNAGVLLCYKGTVYDLSRSDDRKTTAQHAIDAETEADDIRDRNVRTAARTAAAGDPHGRLLFGYTRDYEVVNGQLRCVRQYEHPVQGPYVLAAFQHIDSGRSIASLLRWLRSQEDAARGDGRRWEAPLLRRMLQNRAYLGERVHHGEWRKATWEPIKGLDTPSGRAMFNRVVAKLADPQRLTTTRGTEVAHLLTRIALCGNCGDHAVLVQQSAGQGITRLRCSERRDTNIREELLDAYVEAAVMAWFRKKRAAMAALVPDDADAEAKVEAVQRRINGFEEQLAEARALAEDFDEGTGRFRLSAGSLASMESRLLPKLEQARRELQSTTGVSPLLLSLLNAPDPYVVWNGSSGQDGGPAVPALTVEQRREVIRSVVTVRLYKVRTKSSRGLEPGRIRLSFVGEDGFRDRPLRVPASAPVRPSSGGAGGGTR